MTCKTDTGKDGILFKICFGIFSHCSENKFGAQYNEGTGNRSDFCPLLFWAVEDVCCDIHACYKATKLFTQFGDIILYLKRPNTSPDWGHEEINILGALTIEYKPREEPISGKFQVLEKGTQKWHFLDHSANFYVTIVVRSFSIIVLTKALRSILKVYIRLNQKGKTAVDEDVKRQNDILQLVRL